MEQSLSEPNLLNGKGFFVRNWQKAGNHSCVTMGCYNQDELVAKHLKQSHGYRGADMTFYDNQNSILGHKNTCSKAVVSLNGHKIGDYIHTRITCMDLTKETSLCHLKK